MGLSYLLGGRHGDSDTQGPSRRALFSAATQRREGREEFSPDDSKLISVRTQGGGRRVSAGKKE